MMRDLLKRGDVLSTIAEYKAQLESRLKDFPKDLSIHHQLDAIRAIEHRIRVLAMGGLRVIEGGKQKEEV